MRSACSEAITYRRSNPTHLGAEGTSVFGMGARVPTQVISSLVPASRLPVTLGSGTVWGLPPRHTGLVSHYGQARGVVAQFCGTACKVTVTVDGAIFCICEVDA